MIDITEYLNKDYSEAALYMNFRNTASYIDGLKNAARKTVFVVKKEHIGNEPIKVSAMGSKVVDKAEYLHGDTGIQSTIVTMNQAFTGKNNLPVMEAVGNFGTRFIPEASAARYIFTRPQKYFNLIYRPEDDCNLTGQEFEGKEIEPIFYVPTLPMILVNGTEGIGVGFASTIYPRSIENMIKAIKAKIEGKNLKNDWFIPNWNGFIGKVYNKVDSWVVEGCCEFNNKKVHITELPITENLVSYTKKILKVAKEKNYIQRFNDYSENDKFEFDVWLTDEEAKKSQEQIKKDLGLVTSMSEVFTCIDENNAIKEYKNAKDIFNDYYKIKIKYLKLRIKSEITHLEKDKNEWAEIYKFINEVIKGTIDLKLKKAEVEKNLKEKGYTIIDKLLAMPLYSITKDKAAEIKQKLQDLKDQVDVMKNETPESMWIKDLNELEKELKKEGKL